METREIILKELLETAPFLGKELPGHIPFRVPRGYFDDFADLLMIRIHLQNQVHASFNDEISSISPLLAGLQNRNPYQVPADYFENLAVKKPKAGVKGKILMMRTVRYAAAACIVALIGITLFTVKNSRISSDPLTGLSNISEQDIASYLDSNDVHVTDIASPNGIETASLDFNDNEIHELLGGVSDAELEQYMPALPIEKRNVN